MAGSRVVITKMLFISRPCVTIVRLFQEEGLKERSPKLKAMNQSQYVQEVYCLYEIAKTLNASLDLTKSLQEILRILSKHMGMRRATLTILNPATSEIYIEVAHDLSPEAKKRGKYLLGEGITGRVVQTGEPAVIPKISEEPLFLNRTRSRKDLDKQDISFICVPIKIGRNTIGALSVDRLFSDEVSLQEDLRFLTIITALIAETVKKVQHLSREKEELLNENIRLKKELAEKYQVENIIGNSRPMREVYEMIYKVAKSKATVLLRGESGTGKELVANAIHYQSFRARKPYIKINCAALPETLLESELFGYEKGAFTGATSLKLGRFERAQGGTLFLDEIGDLNPNIQTKLLRVIQEKEFERLGGRQSLQADVRIIAATHQELEKAVEEKRFREDLYYRLNVFPIYLPPLRERRTDILLLADFFLERFNKENRKNIRRISTPAIDLLMQYHWPGNVRELQNCLERAVLICEGEAIKAHHLPPTLQTAESSDTLTRLSFIQAVEAVEKEMIIEALKKVNGNRSRAAEELELTPRIINYKIEKYGIEPRRFKVL
jgi:Nif-specific regulatory protein